MGVYTLNAIAAMEFVRPHVVPGRKWIEVIWRLAKPATICEAKSLEHHQPSREATTINTTNDNHLNVALVYS